MGDPIYIPREAGATNRALPKASGSDDQRLTARAYALAGADMTRATPLIAPLAIVKVLKQWKSANRIAVMGTRALLASDNGGLQQIDYATALLLAFQPQAMRKNHSPKRTPAEDLRNRPLKLNTPHLSFPALSKATPC